MPLTLIIRNAVAAEKESLRRRLKIPSLKNAVWEGDIFNSAYYAVVPYIR